MVEHFIADPTLKVNSVRSHVAHIDNSICVKKTNTIAVKIFEGIRTANICQTFRYIECINSAWLISDVETPIATNKLIANTIRVLVEVNLTPINITV